MQKLLILLIPLLSSCASIESTRSKSTANAPVNEIDGGIATYNNQGWGKEGRRKDAYKKMHNYCKGDYRILEEGERLGIGAAVPAGGAYFYNQSRDWKIKFECVH